jgi:hypothetical protein
LTTSDRQMNPTGQVMIKMKEREWLHKAQLISMLKLVHPMSSERKRKLVLVAFCRRLDHQPYPEQWQEAVTRFEEWLEGAVSAQEFVEAKRRLERVIDSLSNKQDLAFHRLYFASFLIEAGLPGSALLDRLFTEKSQALDYVAFGVVEGHFQKGRDAQCQIVRDIFGNPFHPITFDPSWLTSTVLALARQMYDSRDFSAMPILGDALMDAGCSNEPILEHCRGPGPHVRGCWVCDLCLNKS